MKPLEKSLRNNLETSVKEARDLSEEAAKIALDQLAVGEPTPFSHLTEEERKLRRKLRIHGRNLGDTLNENKTQSMERLIEEMAYEHWHRMLFARFLSENNLLMYPDPNNPIPVTLEECKDLAAKEGAKNGWELAASFAANMLPQIFRTHSPVFNLSFPPEYQKKLEQLIDDLPSEIFTASDSIGWVYQFWQSKKKDNINASEVKIGARELPAVTQLFTEPYMVNFLLHNSLGAWWAARRLAKTELSKAKSEQEVRDNVLIPGLCLDFLRFIKSEGDVWVPAAGTFDQWPQELTEFKILDPCCGSGHFLVAAFLMIVPMRMELEGLSAREAVDVVLKENLYGLEIDRRCVELAAFALALSAWRYPEAGGYRRLPDLNVACCGLAINAKKEDWISLAEDNYALKTAFELLYEQFEIAPVLGSLIVPEVGLGKNMLIEIEWDVLSPILNKALSDQDYMKSDMGVVAQGVAKTAQILSCKYNLIVTNVPYLSRGKQKNKLRDYCAKFYPKAKNDLATVFLSRCLKLSNKDGVISIVLPQNWLFLVAYKKFRMKLLETQIWQLITRLGPGAFETISGEVVKAILLIISCRNFEESTSPFPASITNNLIRGLNVSESKTAIEKAMNLRSCKITTTEQIKQLKNPDSRVTFEDMANLKLLKEYSNSYQGISPADSPRFSRYFWESHGDGEWIFWQSTVPQTRYFGGQEHILWMNEVKRKAEEEKTAYIRGTESWGKGGIIVSQIGNLSAALSTGYPTDTNAATIVPHDQTHLPAIWCFCSSNKYNETVRQIDQTLKVTNATLVKIPFDIDYWTKVAKDKYPSGLPKPYSDEPTQWIFHGYPRRSQESLHVAVARLLGYRWPPEFEKTIDLSELTHNLIQKSNALIPYSDADGIVCIPPIRGEMKAADRLENLLAASYGDKWSYSKKSDLLAKVGFNGKTLETWLRDKFFIQHCKLFYDRPFVWHIWDGLNDGFAALVNYHKLDKKKLETLIYTYLGDWISRQKQDISCGVDGAEEKLAAAEGLKKRLELILEGEAPYDIFVRWKPVEEQPIGWNPDLNDGVRLNIRPFMSVPDVGRKGAGVLRDKPNIKWTKDRGKDVDNAPWFNLGPSYGGVKGDRINDHHLSLKEKEKAREKKE